MLKTLFSRVRQYKKYAMITPISMIGEVAMEVLIPTLMALIIDKGVANGDMAYIWKMSLYLVGAAFMALTFGVLSARMGATASAGFATNLRHDIYEKVMDFSFKDIDRFSVSSLITRMTTDVQNVQNSFQMAIRMAFRSPVMLIFAIIMVIRNGSELAAVFAIAIPVIICGIILTFSLTKKYFERAFKGFDKFNRVVQENLNGIRTVKAYVREEVEEDKFRESAEDIKYNFSKGQKIMAATHPVIMLISYTCMIAISYLGAKIINVGNMETGELMSIYTYTGQILSSLIMTGMIIIMFSISWPSMKRIAEVLESEISMDLNEDGIKSVPNGSVSFKNVDFAYKEGKNVLKNINLDIKSGETVGILGTTGSGKTTLISLIARLYDVTSGSLCVGGIDVKDYNVHALRDAVSVVLQKNTLFSGTIAENLRWGDMNGSLDKMEEVAKHASAFGFISEKENGFDSRVEQGGSNFSGGQKQRLTIARALMKEPKILILDDSTSAVDTATDRSIREALNKSVKGMTKIIISQRISSIEDADKIVIMNKGEIEAVGTHDELIETNEAYRDLYETQTRGANG